MGKEIFFYWSELIGMVRSRKVVSNRRKKRSVENKRSKAIKGDDVNVGPPDIELPVNPSEFAVFANVRRAVLEAWAGKASQIYLATTGNQNADTIDAETDSEATEVWHPPPPRLPKVFVLWEFFECK